MPAVKCPKCGDLNVVPGSRLGKIVGCDVCQEPFRALRQGSRRPGRLRSNPPLPVGNLKTTVYLVAVLGFVGGGLLLGLVGVVCSQYAPVFGDFLTLNLAQPWSRARLSLVPIHAFAFGFAGSVGGCAFATLLYLAIEGGRPK